MAIFLSHQVEDYCLGNRQMHKFPPKGSKSVAMSYSYLLHTIPHLKDVIYTQGSNWAKAVGAEKRASDIACVVSRGYGGCLRPPVGSKGRVLAGRPREALRFLVFQSRGGGPNPYPYWHTFTKKGYSLWHNYC